MNIKCKTRDIRTCEKHLFIDMSSTNIDTFAPSLYQCVETRSIEVFSLLSQPLPPPPLQPLRHQRNVWHHLWTARCTRQTFPTVKRKHFFMKILCIESFCPQKETHNRTLLFGSTLLKHSRHGDYWNQPLNVRMRVCYLDCYEIGLCCYLVIQIENLLHTLQLFYFNLWPIYWLRRINKYKSKWIIKKMNE
jgi:hypothetical protein